MPEIAWATISAYENGAEIEVADYYDFGSTWVDVGDTNDKDEQRD